MIDVGTEETGYEAGKDEGAAEKGFSDTTAGPSWLAMAQYCAEHDNGGARIHRRHDALVHAPGADREAG